MELHGSRPARQFLLQAAEGSAMDLGEYRLSPYPPPQSAHSQLSLAEVSRKRPAVRGGNDNLVAVEPAIFEVPLLGRASQGTRRLRAHSEAQGGGSARPLLPPVTLTLVGS